MDSYFNTENMTGIYIVCSDSNLLADINRMFKRRGIIGVTDTAGRVRYIVDVRSNKWNAVKAINRFLNLEGFTELTEMGGEAAEERIVNEAVGKVLSEYGFNPSHLGTKALFILVKMILDRGIAMKNVSVRELYNPVADHLRLSYSQMERNIRYAVKSSGMNAGGTRTSILVQKLALEVSELLRSDPA